VISWNKDLVATGLTELARIQPGVLNEVKRLLNSYHKWDKSTAYYDVILGDWLLHFMHQVYVAYKEVEVSKPSDANFKLSVFSDAIDFLSHATNHASLQCELQATINVLLIGREITDLYFACDSVTIINRQSESSLIKLIRYFSTSTPKLLVTDPYFKCSKLTWLFTLLKWRGWVRWDNLAYPITIVSTLNSTWRLDQAARVCPANDLVQLIKALVPIYLPIALLEGFAEYRKAALAFPVKRPAAVYSAQSLQTNLAWKVLVAEWKEQGTLLLYHQHGGGYGIDYEHALEEFEIRVADRYYTLGWRTKKNSVRPLNAPAIHVPRRKRSRQLLVCLGMPKHPYRLHFQPMPGTIETVQTETSDFLSSLNDREKLLLRPSSDDYGWGTVEMMMQVAPELEVDDLKTSAASRFAESTVVIHNYMGTSWLETLALDIPTLCFYDPRTYVFREPARPYIDALERVGIVHRSGNSAARFLNNVSGRLELWWQTPEVQKARQEFVVRYANYSADWVQQWRIEFQNVSSLSIKTQDD
jgi:putative transferase (TIGR04331 family)